MPSRVDTPHTDPTLSSRSLLTTAAFMPLPRPGPRLRGREQQRERLLHLLDTTRSGPRRGGVALVEGVAGAGRSRLLGDTCAVAAQCGFSVAYADADEVRRAVPLAPLIAALDLRTDVEHPPLDLAATAAGHSAWLIDRLHTSLAERLRRGPVAVVLDDLQWADTTTLAALGTLVARCATQQVAWVLARRAGEAESLPAKLFAALGDAERSERVHLPPLDDRAVAELAADRLSAEPAPELLACVKGADGNPAALVALLDGLVEEQRVRVAEGRARPAGDVQNGPVPRRFGVLVRDRAAALQPGTRLLLDVACVLGHAALPEDIAQILGGTTASVLPALQEALDSRFLVCEGDTIAFRHELVRQALLATLPGPLRGSLHRQAADMIIGRDGGVLPAAAHLVHGARRGDTRAVTVLCSAATAVVATEPRTAAELAQRALEITGPLHPVRANLVRVAVEALTRCGPLPRAIALAEESLGGALPQEQATVLRCELSAALLLAGRAARAVAVAGPPPPGAAAAEGLAERMELGRLHGLADLDAAAAEREARQEMTRRGGPSAGLRCVLARSHWHAGRVGEALRQARAAVASAGEERGVCRPFAPRLALAAMLTHLRETTEATALLDVLRGEIEAEGWPVLCGAAKILGSSLALAQGALAEAATQAAGGLAAADEAGMPRYSPLGWRTLAEVALRRGDLTAADEHVERLTRTVAEQGLDGAAATASRAGAAWMAAQLAAARRDVEGLDAALAAVHADPYALRSLLCEEPAAAAWLVRTAADRGDGERAAETVRAAQRLATDNADVPSLLAAAAHAQGVHQRDADALRRAVQTHRDPWSRASAAEDLGALCGADRAATVMEFEWAMAKYARLGAARDEARVRRRLRRLGVRRRHWKHADRPASGWASLTDTERRVADLVAQGLTNRQVATQMFLSSHTVGFHLRQIYRKLRLRSRIDLARTHPGVDDGPGRHVTDRPAPPPADTGAPADTASPRGPAPHAPKTPPGPALPAPAHPADTTQPR
ncbi:helix-turn-helix transcriptional regulator [Streptomyces alfalfae]|uniref:AAA family ATPase n=1 Tax=Streptomyces alfalfae TaxID=1642299 RepID=A0A7T4PCN8_9ACTN|nr:LuxR family transcriptional regulator [Streptomyces alfalfae]QQC87568.1 AAA family ATPase [Streptomyces alfalfae]